MKTGTERLKVMVNSRETLHLFTLGHQQRLCVWFDDVLCAVGVVEQQLCFCGSGRPAGASAGQTRGWEHSRSVAGWTPAAVPPERIRDLPAVSAQPELQLPELPDSVNGLDLTHFLFKYPKPVKSTEWSSVWISQECCMEFSLGVWVMWYWHVCVCDEGLKRSMQDFPVWMTFSAEQSCHTSSSRSSREQVLVRCSSVCVVLLSGSDQLINNTVSLWCSGAACVSNDSSQWLISNFGQFSALVPLNQLISLNPQFNPVQSLKHIYSANSHCTHQDLGFPLKHMWQLPEKQNWVRYWANFLLRSINWYIDALRWAWACRDGAWFCASVADLHITMSAWLSEM